MGDAIQKVIENSKIARVEVFVRNKEEQEAEKARREAEKSKQGVMGSVLEELARKNKEVDPIEGEKLADGFVRSQRNVALRIKDELNNQVVEVEQQKTELIQKLNHALVKLDKLNTTKREMSNLLVEKIKFVRDLQQATSGGDDIENIVSAQMKEEFRKEQQINHRLREEIKRCEMDRKRIIEQLKLLTGEKEITVQTSDGLHKTFKVTQVNIGLLLDDLKFLKQSADQKGLQVEQTQDIIQQQQLEILDMERRLQELKRLRDEAADKTGYQQRRWDDNIGQIQDDIGRKQRLHLMHVKLCASRHLQETMQKIVGRNQQIAFDWMQATVVGNFVKFGAVYKLKKMFKANDQTRAKNALLRWFKIACDPVALIRVNRGIPELYEANISKSFFFNKWRIRQFRQYADQLKTKLKLRKMWHSLDRYWKRRMKVNFLCWRDSLIRKNDAIRTMYSFIDKQRYSRVIQAFMKWRGYKDNQDFNARMHALSISIATARLQQQIFQAWRIQSHQKKQRRLLRQKQAYKCLRINALRERQFKKKRLWADKLFNTGGENILKVCLDALRHNAKAQRYKDVSNKLQTDLKPAIQAFSFKISNLLRKQDLDERTRRTQCLVTLFGRQLSKFFHHWRQQAAYNTVVINTSLRLRIVKLHRDSLQRAFNLWREGRSWSCIIEQQQSIQELQAGNFSLQEESRNVQRAIDDKDQSSKSSGSRKLHSMLAIVLQKHSKHFWDRWCDNVAHRRLEENKAGLLIKRIYTKIMRVYWSKYKCSFNIIVQEEKNQKRMTELRARLETKSKQRIYNAWQGYSTSHRNAKNFLRSLVKRLDKVNKGQALKIWSSFNKSITVEEQRVEQAEQVGNLYELRQSVGETGDELKNLKDQKKRLEKALLITGQKTLQKWIVRTVSQSLEYGFKSWKAVSDDLGHRQTVQRRVLGNLNRITLNIAWRNWQQAIQTEDREQIIEVIKIEEVGNGCLESAIQLKKREIKGVQDQIARRIGTQEYKTKVHQQRIQEVIVKLIQMNDQNHFMSIRRASFFNWREYVNRRRRCCHLLSRAVFMMLATRAFNQIKDDARAKHKAFMDEKGSTKIFNLFNKCLVRRAYNKWRVSNYHLLKEKIQATKDLANEQSEDNAASLAMARQTYANCKFKRIKKQRLQDYLDAIRKFSHNKRELRIAKERLHSNAKVLYQRQFILKWKARVDQTHKMKSLKKEARKKINQIYRKAVFQAWRREFKIVKRFCCRVDQAMTALSNLQKHQTFDILKRFSQIKYFTIRQRKHECRKRLIQCIGFYNLTSMRRGFGKFKMNADNEIDKLYRLKSIVVKGFASSQKRMFNRWKQAAKEIWVKEANEHEDGPVNLQCFVLRQQNENLQKMLIEDGSTPNQIEKVQKDKENQYKSYVEQSLCRLLCKEDPDLQLLPYFLDRWKKFSQMRKLWKRAIYHCNLRQSRDTTLSSKLWAFQKWKYQQTDRHNVLQTKPIKQLQVQCIKNVEQLELLADALEANDGLQQTLLDQRRELLKNQISGQRIGLALIRAHKEKTMQTAMTRWTTDHTTNLRGKVECSLIKNLNTISALKDRIADIERRNEQLAIQNDLYREGAMDGIMMAKHCEELHKDRECLSVDLADKAITIRKLLEDNSYLHSKLQQIITAKRF